MLAKGALQRKHPDQLGRWSSEMGSSVVAYSPLACCWIQAGTPPSDAGVSIIILRVGSMRMAAGGAAAQLRRPKASHALVRAREGRHARRLPPDD